MARSFEDFAFARDEQNLGASRRSLSRAASKQLERRIARGAYLSEDVWAKASPSDRYWARVMAIAMTRVGRPVISHWSAGVFYNVPRIGDWPTQVHFTVPPTAASGSRNDVVKHRQPLNDEDVVEFEGLLFTSLARTVLDIAATSSFRDAVMVADAVLSVDRLGRRPPRVTREQLEAAWVRAQPSKSHARTKAVLDFAETGAETPIESASRVTMRTIGVPRPALQVAHYDSRGFIGDTDFAWLDFSAVGEADGDQKYLDPAFRGGRTPERVFLDEKRREDRLRALPRKVGRWSWAVAMSPRLLLDTLTAIGLPTGQKW
jgi:hypothetical protein